ncbi:ohcu decarboxylase protein, partial [Moniliophthora roreri]
PVFVSFSILNTSTSSNYFSRTYIAPKSPNENCSDDLGNRFSYRIDERELSVKLGCPACNWGCPY